jgi:hypothetical protein
MGALGSVDGEEAATEELRTGVATSARVDKPGR